MQKKSMKRITSIVLAFMMVVSMLMGNTKTAEASATNILIPITSVYTLTTGNTTVYSAVNGSTYGSIYGTDSCKITALYSSGWCKVTYPVTGGTKTGYCKTTAFISNLNYDQKNLSIKSNAPVYRRSSLTGTQLGTTYTSDTIVAVGETTSAYQILYNVSGGYKCGWINKSYVTSPSTSSTYSLPIKAVYPIATSSVNTYAAYNSRYSSGSIYTTDECQISQVYSNGWCKVIYPVSGGTKTGYCKTSTFFNTGFSPYKISLVKNATVFKKSDLATSFGTAYSTDTVYVVGQTSSAYQITYNVTGGYKCGWISKNYASQGTTVAPSTPSVTPSTNTGATLSTPVKGIDVSVYNGTINWNSVKAAGINFAIIQLGYRGYGSAGTIVMDSKYKTNIAGATAAGVNTGVYFFTQAITTAEAVQEANYVLSNISGYKITYPIVIDIEAVNATSPRTKNLTNAQRTAICKAFCDTINAAGYKSAIYSNQYYINNMLNVSELSAYDIWMASYTSSKPSTSFKYTMWQYSETGSVSGITGNVDMNYSYKDYAGNASSSSSSTTTTTQTFTYPMSSMYVCGNNWSQYYSVKGKYHLGLDVASSTGDANVYAITDGVVAQVGYNSANGNTISIKHTISGKTVYAFYAHLKSQSVSVGQKVTTGQKVGVYGNTGGSSTGAHLHFGITTMCSSGTWGYGTAATPNRSYYNGNYYYNPFYVIKNGALPTA